MTKTEVTRDQFYKAIGPLNVHPRTEPDASYWETPARLLVGISTPGWRDGGLPQSMAPRRYYLVREATS